MKKGLILFLCLVLILGAVSCGKTKESAVTGTDISKYTIVYREVMGSYVEEFTDEKYAAIRLQDLILRTYGIQLNIQKDSEEAAEYEIVLGEARDHAAIEDVNGYSLKSEDKNIHINAGTVLGYTTAFSALVENVTLEVPQFPDNYDVSGKISYDAQAEEDFAYVDKYEMTRSTDEAPIKKLTIGGVDISKYKIVYHDWEMKTYGLNEVYAAEELQKYIQLATGIELERVTDDTKPTDYEIVVGITSREGDVISKIDRSTYGEEGLLIKSEGTRLILTGAERRGTLYAVYSFLEEYVGYRFFADNCEVVYKSDAVELANDIYDEQLPALEYRDCDQYQILNHDYAAKRKINSGNRRTMNYKLGGNFNYGGEFVHTMSTSFKLSDGNTQPCFSDEENFEKAREMLLTLCKRLTDAKVISISQNDNYDFCNCKDCAKVNKEEGSYAGAMIRFINRLAKEIETDYPDLKIITLAYMFSIDPPKTAPNDNVVIMYCPIESCCACPLNDGECETNVDFKEDLEGWCELSDNIYIWYYVAEYTKNGQLPFMNFDAMYDNYKYFYSLGIKGMFNQGYLHDPGTEFGALRAYMLSLLMWKPEITKEEYNAEMVAFIDAYYGSASELIKEYFFALEIASEGTHFAQYATANSIVKSNYFKPFKNEFDRWWDNIMEYEITDERIKTHIEELYNGYCYLKNSLL